MGEKRGVYRVLVRNLRERDHLEDAGIYDGMILKLSHRRFIHPTSYTDWPETEHTNRR